MWPVGSDSSIAFDMQRDTTCPAEIPQAESLKEIANGLARLVAVPGLGKRSLIFSFWSVTQVFW
jgi:hypothetical protein